MSNQKDSGDLQIEIRRIVSALNRVKGFALFIAQCSYPAYRKRLVEILRSKLKKPITEVDFDSGWNMPIDIYIDEAARKNPQSVIFLYGLERITSMNFDTRQRILQEINLRRRYYADIKSPLVLWLPSFAVSLFMQGVPDLIDWYSGSYELEIPIHQEVAFGEDHLFSFYVIQDEGDDAGFKESYSFSHEDRIYFEKWRDSYRRILSGARREGLSDIGRDIYGWLNGLGSWLARVRNIGHPPLILEFSVPENTSPDHLLFLEVPWELLADEKGHWAADPALKYCPIRRIGRKEQPEAPSQYRLSMIFMAAAPLGSTVLNYEAEEAAVFKSTGNVGMDLFVEESGELALLSETVSKVAPIDVLHISCCGKNRPEPKLILETSEGMPLEASPRDLKNAIGSHCPRLLFLSAGGTEYPDRFLNSFSSDMIKSGIPALLAWGGAVFDAETVQFEKELYSHLSNKETLENATALARYFLVSIGPQVSKNWHMARLYMGSRGGGAFCDGNKSRSLVLPDRIQKTFLDSLKRRIPIAGIDTFVGRRRHIQKILKVFHKDQYAGVIIHGFKGHGKSSLAARVANRVPDIQPVVVFGEYDASSILEALWSALNIKEILESVSWAKRSGETLLRDSTQFYQVLLELLEGYCRETRRDKNGALQGQSVLLIIDDFERAFTEPVPGKNYRIRPEYVESVCALLEAFLHANTSSRLLITSRYLFSLRGRNDEELVKYLYHLPLHSMDKYERQKQVYAKERSMPGNLYDRSDKAEQFQNLVDRCIETARGNPMLQNLLFMLAAESPDICARTLNNMGAYLSGTKTPDDPNLRDFLESLLIQELTELLTPSETQLLQASAMFSIPVPVAVFEALCSKLGVETQAIQRLVALTLWDEFEDMVKPSVTAAAVNALARAIAFQPELLQNPECKTEQRRKLLQNPECKTETKAELLQNPECKTEQRWKLLHAVNGEWKLTPPSPNTQVILAKIALPVLFECWGGADRAVRPYLADYELTRLGLMTENTEVLAVAAEDALTWLEEQFQYKEAAEIARNVIRILDAAEMEASPGLLRVACERCRQVGDVDNALAFIKRSIDFFELELKNGNLIDESGYSHSLLNYARMIQQKGKPDEALPILENVAEIYKKLGNDRNRAVTLGDIARIRVDKGEVDEALKLHEERIQVFEALGDRRERAVTLGD
ncbi:MAG: tetratricopeptide repeat protein, partial [Desulfobacterales bacterium]|nr:tetratricopeptide repeat protein [Desulfobacterales bacterium]